MNSPARHYQAPADLLQDHVILVTGAGQGLGLQAALSYAQHGATVILLGRTQSKLEAAYDLITQQADAQPMIFCMDLQSATEADMQALAEGIYQQLGRLDGILHSASRLDNLSPLMIQTGEQFQQIFQVNLIAPFMLSKACMPLLAKASQASVLMTSHSATQHMNAFWGAYGLSKLAAEQLMLLWEKEKPAPHIRFNCILPGAVQTPQRKKTHPGELHHSLPSAEQLMPLYLYLMGKDSASVSGQIFAAQEWAI